MSKAGKREPWDFGDLEGYIREKEPGAVERAENWQTAIGLQAVDGLTTSPYLLETAREHIEGRIGIDEAQRRIRSYYEERSNREAAEGEKEADIVSSRIAQLLGEHSFTFSPAQMQDIHRRLFVQLLPCAGEYRTYDITKKEWVLKGETVLYASHSSILDALRYDFAQERDFNYVGLTVTDVAHHMAHFVSGIWQVHPFGEGNTRTTAVFVIKYLRSMGFVVDNEPFREHSWYFRNALVRANYEDVLGGVEPTTLYLEKFFENLLRGNYHELRNRYLHLDWARQEISQKQRGTSQETSKEHTETSKEMRARILAILSEEPESTARSLAQRLGLTPQGVRYHLDVLKNAGRIHHEGSTKAGRWVIDE